MNRLLLLAAVVLMAILTDGKTLVVDPAGDGRPTTLDDAVAMAGPGDEIILMAGSYHDVAIDRSLSISGLGKVVINGGGNSALVISAPGCKISNLYIEGSGSNPGAVLRSSDNILANCSFNGGYVGVEVFGTNNTIRDSIIDSSLCIKLSGSRCVVENDTFRGDKGIQMKESAENIIEGCRFLTSAGIEVSSSTRNKILKNILSGSRFGITLAGSDKNNLTENQISGRYISGLDILESSGNNLSANSLEGCMLGISLRQSNSNNLTNNSARENERAGIYLNSSQDNRLLDNYLSGNGNGILLASSSRNNIISNHATMNTYGISLRGSAKNVLRNNTLRTNQYNLRIDPKSEMVQVQDDFIQEIDLSNKADGKPICYLVGERDMRVPDGCGYVALIGCQNVSTSNQTITNSSIGVLLVGSTGCTLVNCTIQNSETGFSMIDSSNWNIELCLAKRCKMGFRAIGSQIGSFNSDAAINCSESGFRSDGSSSLILNGSEALGNNVGISFKGSMQCQVQNSRAKSNKEAGVEMSSSPKCSLVGVESSQNKIGISLVGSNDCQINDSHFDRNIQDGLALILLEDAQVRRNAASGNGQGIYVQSSKGIRIYGNNLSSNIRQGLRMSSSSRCNITDNRFIRNQISGANLIDCIDNYIYHNIFIENGYQNAVDNGDNHWDGGPKTGGNYWGDFKVDGNPGNVPRRIQTKGEDRYPFHDPEGWR